MKITAPLTIALETPEEISAVFAALEALRTPKIPVFLEQKPQQRTARKLYGSRLKDAGYYEEIKKALDNTPKHCSIKMKADILNSKGFKTPSGLSWNRQHLSNYLSYNNFNKDYK